MSLIYTDTFTPDNEFDISFLREITKKRLYKELVSKIEFKSSFSAMDQKTDIFIFISTVSTNSEDSRVWVLESSHPMFPYYFIIYFNGYFITYRIADLSVKKTIANCRNFVNILNKSDRLVGYIKKCHARVIEKLFNYFETNKFY